MKDDIDIDQETLNDIEIDDKDKFKTYRLKDSKFRNLFKQEVPRSNTENKIKRNNKLITRRSLDKKYISANIKPISPVESNSNSCKEIIQLEEKEQNDENFIDDDSHKNNISTTKSNTISRRQICVKKNHQVRDCNILEDSIPRVEEYIDKMELTDVPESESPIIIDNNPKEGLSKINIENCQLKYFRSKKKPSLEFSFEFLQSFANKSDIIERNYSLPYKPKKVNKNCDNEQVNNYLDLSGYCATKKTKIREKKYDTYNISKRPRTRSLIIKKIDELLSMSSKKNQCSSLDSSWRASRGTSNDTFQISTDLTRDDRSDRTFTRQSLLQRINDVRCKFDCREVVANKPVNIPRHLSDNCANIKAPGNLKSLKKMFSLYNTKSSHFVSQNDLNLLKCDKEIRKADGNNVDIDDESYLMGDLMGACNDLVNISDHVRVIFQENHELFDFDNIIDFSTMKPLLSEILELKSSELSTTDKQENKNKNPQSELPRKHIYAELLVDIVPMIIEDAISKIKIHKKTSKNKGRKSKSRNSNETDKCNSVFKEMQTNLSDYFLNSIIHESIFTVSEDLRNEMIFRRNVSELNSDITEEFDEFGLKFTNKDDNFIGYQTKKSREWKNNDNRSGGANERFGISWKDETLIPDQIKQTILMYDAQIRKSTAEKNELCKENFEIIEMNRALQKRNCVLLTEFKQEKRETAFIKNQISVMLSRMQSIPEKLTQLESENASLKAEVSDLERTLGQRDQLFISERQMNASLSEEIVKLESESVNKELMKNVCEEFENLNEEYEILKKTLEETEDKLFEIVQDRDNLIKHAKVMEDHLYKLKAENNYLVQNCQILSSGGAMDSSNNGWALDNRDPSTYGQQANVKSNSLEDNGHESRHSSNIGKSHYSRRHCGRSKHRNNSHNFHYSTTSDSSSSSSSYGSDSSSDYKRKHKKKSKHSHKHKHKKSHSHKNSHKKRKSRKDNPDDEVKVEIDCKNQNANVAESPAPFVIEMPKNREELKKLEIVYDDLQLKKGKLEAMLSHIPMNKGVSNSSNMTNMQEQETLEDDLDQCDKQLASLRKILKQCKVFKMIP